MSGPSCYITSLKAYFVWIFAFPMTILYVAYYKLFCANNYVHKEKCNIVRNKGEGDNMTERARHCVSTVSFLCL